jgi:acylphosphatase
MIRLHAVVRGRVQGVGYRYFAHHVAHQVGAIHGAVRNLPDGAVEVQAEADERGPLEALLKELHTGPSTARVETVDTVWEEDVAPRYATGFQVA